MAGAMRKMAVYLGLVEDDQYEDDMMYSDGAGDVRGREQERDREPDRGGRDRYADRSERDTLRVSEREADDLTRRRQNGDRQNGDRQNGDRLNGDRNGYDRQSADRPSRDWRTDTIAAEQVGSHPAGSRAKRPAKPAGEGYKITTLHPRSYNDARRIGEEFRSGTPVIMNLTELDDTDAKRIVDFAAGLVFGLRGSIERVTNKVFMLSPANVQVGADVARAQLEQDGFVSKR